MVYSTIRKYNDTPILTLGKLEENIEILIPQFRVFPVKFLLIQLQFLGGLQSFSTRLQGMAKNVCCKGNKFGTYVFKCPWIYWMCDLLDG
jgi:hypothetical protein